MCIRPVFATDLRYPNLPRPTLTSRPSSEHKLERLSNLTVTAYSLRKGLLLARAVLRKTKLILYSKGYASATYFQLNGL